jgi:serine/threonine-protein kinase
MSDRPSPPAADRPSPRGLLQRLRRVKLRDVESATPAPAGEAPRTEGRYELRGELGRGGMGIVVRGVDTELGRDVALKVLDKDLAGRPEVVQRFIEEAQIGGQLQHPGIVPVYELGLMADERPFFSMKLVKGRTLASLLSARTPGDARRLLEIFASVCQTLAYAHSRGVIHRDVKPANVMVGAFGEVQVVDWGLAKVLDHADAPAADRSIIQTVRSGPDSDASRSEAGAVFGTPNYMSPEQARGEIGAVDERSDVFALGAMLCEILTGKPPWADAGGSPVQVAAAGKVESARRRLAACDADPELVDLAAACLQPDAAQRPAQAGAVAQRVLEHLANVEERARRAHLEAVEARVKAEGERRAQRLTLALASSIVLTLLLAGGSWIWFSQRAAGRARQTETDIAAALAEATHELGAQHWSEALGAAGRARGLASSSAVEGELAARAARDVAVIEARVQAERDREQLARDNVALLADLENVRRAVGLQSYASDAAEREADYGRAFARHGLGLDPATLVVDQAAVAWRARGIPLELASTLDEWAVVKRELGDLAGARRLIDLALAVDPDSLRSRLRHSPDRAEVLALAAQANLDALPASTLSLIGTTLASLGDYEAAVTTLDRAALLHPDDFPIAMNLGSTLRNLESPRLHEAARAYGAALALRPGSGAATCALAVTLHELGETPRAVALMQVALAQHPDDARLHGQLARIHSRAGHVAEAEAEARAALALAPDDLSALTWLSIALLDRGEIEGALQIARRAVEVEPGNDRTHYNLARALSAHGEKQAAIDAYRRSLDINPDFAAAHNNLGSLLSARGEYAAALAERRRAVELDPRDAAAVASLAWMLSMCPDASLRDPGQAVRWARVGIELEPTRANPFNNLGAALCREGRWAEAVEALERSLALCGSSDEDTAVAIVDHALLALAHARLGDVDAARRELATAEAAPGSHRATGDLAQILAEAREAIDEAGGR